MGRHDDDARAEYPRKIRDLNDQLRRETPHGSVLLTRAVALLDDETVRAILSAISEFDDFTADNDPWREHDFGQVAINGVPIFWRIDAYDMNLECGSADPTDDTVTKRILTIMTAHDL